jgi:hypothetical protein
MVAAFVAMSQMVLDTCSFSRLQDDDYRSKLITASRGEVSKGK